MSEHDTWPSESTIEDVLEAGMGLARALEAVHGVGFTTAVKRTGGGDLMFFVENLEDFDFVTVGKSGTRFAQPVDAGSMSHLAFASSPDELLARVRSLVDAMELGRIANAKESQAHIQGRKAGAAQVDRTYYKLAQDGFAYNVNTGDLLFLGDNDEVYLIYLEDYARNYSMFGPRIDRLSDTETALVRILRNSLCKVDGHDCARAYAIGTSDAVSKTCLVDAQFDVVVDAEGWHAPRDWELDMGQSSIDVVRSLCRLALWRATGIRVAMIDFSGDSAVWAFDTQGLDLDCFHRDDFLTDDVLDTMISYGVERLEIDKVTDVTYDMGELSFYDDDYMSFVPQAPDGSGVLRARGLAEGHEQASKCERVAVKARSQR